jgi:Sulfotransferase family
VTTPSPEKSPLLSETHQLVFVGGLHRSGTSPLSRLLATHPDVSGFQETGVDEDEGQHLQTVYAPARVYGGAGRFALDPRSHLTETAELVSETNARTLLDEWSHWWDTSRPLLLEKSPPNLVMTRFLQALYPGARFVVIVRNPVVVALSTKKWRRGTSLATMLDNWVVAHRTFRDDASHLTHVEVVNYEHLVQDAAAVLARLSTFLELSTPLSPELWQSSRSATYEEWWQRLRSSRVPGRGSRVAALIERFEPEVNELGYSLLDLEHVDRFPIPTA